MNYFIFLLIQCFLTKDIQNDYLDINSKDIVINTYENPQKENDILQKKNIINEKLKYLDEYEKKIEYNKKNQRLRFFTLEKNKKKYIRENKGIMLNNNISQITIFVKQSSLQIGANQIIKYELRGKRKDLRYSVESEIQGQLKVKLECVQQSKLQLIHLIIKDNLNLRYRIPLLKDCSHLNSHQHSHVFSFSFILLLVILCTCYSYYYYRRTQFKYEVLNQQN